MMSRNRGRNKKRKGGTACEKYPDHAYMRMRMEGNTCWWLYTRTTGRLTLRVQRAVLIPKGGTSFFLCEHCVHRIKDED